MGTSVGDDSLAGVVVAPGDESPVPSATGGSSGMGSGSDSTVAESGISVPAVFGSVDGDSGSGCSEGCSGSVSLADMGGTMGISVAPGSRGGKSAGDAASGEGEAGVGLVAVSAGSELSG